MAYFVLVQIPYEGTAVSKFETKEAAEQDYGECKKHMMPGTISTSWYNGIALIEGEVLAEHGLSPVISPVKGGSAKA